jgi:hypothetical protein
MLLLQKALETWENSLKITCGAIVPKKTVWWSVSFKWTGLSWRYESQGETPGDLYVNDILNTNKKLTRLEPHQAYETLGVHLAPDGNSLDQFIKLLQLATSWSDSMRTGNISKDDAWLALTSMIW